MSLRYFSDFFPSLSALKGLIIASDAKVISSLGVEVLDNEDKMNKVKAAVEVFKSNENSKAASLGNPSRSKQHMIIVDF